LQSNHKRRALFLADAQTLLARKAVNGALDVEQRIDALDRLQRDRRDRRGILSAPCIGGDVGQLEELTPGMGPAQCRRDRSLGTRWVVKRVVAAVGIGLQDAGEALQMALGMLLSSIS
jgi:hypothetical protein